MCLHNFSGDPKLKTMGFKSFLDFWSHDQEFGKYYWNFQSPEQNDFWSSEIWPHDHFPTISSNNVEIKISVYDNWVANEVLI